jgi:hypothetical protein
MYLGLLAISEGPLVGGERDCRVGLNLYVEDRRVKPFGGSKRSQHDRGL